MANRDLLATAGLRAYELGRLRRAAWVALIIVPAGILCAWVTGEGESCACLAAILLGLSVYLRWRNRIGAKGVGIGLISAVVALCLGLGVSPMIPQCADASLFSFCTGAGVMLGLLTGIAVSLQTARIALGRVEFLGAAGVAFLAASMGCVGLGLTQLIGLGAGLIGGSVGVALIQSRSRQTR